MRLQSLEGSALAIPFKGSFKHASAERSAMQSLWVCARATSGETGFGEGCPREYVTAESMSSSLAFVDRHRTEWLASLHDLHSIEQWSSTHRAQIDAHPAAWTAVELALLDLMGKTRQCAVEKVLGLPALQGRFHYTAVIGDGSPQQFAAQLQQFLKAGFKTFKIKLATDVQANLLKVRALTDAGIAAEHVRADANNLWRDVGTCVADLEALQFPFAAIEEPLRPGDFAGLAAVASALNTRIILDESITRTLHLDQIPQPPERWILNCRVSKMGGLLRALELLKSAQSRGIAVIVGAHVGETSVLTRAALILARAAGGLLIAQEGAFGTHLLTRDVADPPLMFGAGGIIDIAMTGLATRSGLGLKIAEDVPG